MSIFVSYYPIREECEHSREHVINTVVMLGNIADENRRVRMLLGNLIRLAGCLKGGLMLSKLSFSTYISKCERHQLSNREIYGVVNALLWATRTRWWTAHVKTYGVLKLLQQKKAANSMGYKIKKKNYISKTYTYSIGTQGLLPQNVFPDNRDSHLTIGFTLLKENTSVCSPVC